jgi:tellurite resistance protein
MSTMTPDEVRAVLTVSVMAAFADGRKHEREREELRRIADGLSQDDAVHLPTLVQDVLTGRMTLAGLAPRLAGDNARHLAYEMAVCVCDADGAQSEAERGFLRSLAQALRLDTGETDPISAQAEALAAAPLAGGAAAATTAATMALPATNPTAPAQAPAATAAAAGSVTANVDDATLDRMILNAAILNGAIELLPESLSTLAIIPLQMRLVYRIGAAHGYELDSGHIRDFLATVGVGLTSQYLEQAGRKLLGGLLGRELRHHLRARACGQTLLRRRAPVVDRDAQAGLPGHDAPGPGPAPAPPARDPRTRPRARCRQGAGAGAGLIGRPWPSGPLPRGLPAMHGLQPRSQRGGDRCSAQRGAYTGSQASRCRERG